MIFGFPAPLPNFVRLQSAYRRGIQPRFRCCMSWTVSTCCLLACGSPSIFDDDAPLQMLKLSSMGTAISVQADDRRTRLVAVRATVTRIGGCGRLMTSDKLPHSRIPRGRSPGLNRTCHAKAVGLGREPEAIL